MDEEVQLRRFILSLLIELFNLTMRAAKHILFGTIAFVSILISMFGLFGTIGWPVPLTLTIILTYPITKALIG